MSNPITILNNDIRALFDYARPMRVRVWSTTYDLELKLTRRQGHIHAALSGAPQLWKMRGGLSDGLVTSNMIDPSDLKPRISELYCVMVHLRNILKEMQTKVREPEEVSISLTVKGCALPIAMMYNGLTTIYECNPDYSIGKMVSFIGGGKYTMDDIPGTRCKPGPLGLDWLTNFDPSLSTASIAVFDSIEKDEAMNIEPIQSTLNVSEKYVKYFLTYDAAAYFKR